MLAASRLVARLNWLRLRGGLMGDIIKPSEEGIHYMQTEGHFDFCLTCKEKLPEGYNGFYKKYKSGPFKMLRMSISQVLPIYQFTTKAQFDPDEVPIRLLILQVSTCCRFSGSGNQGWILWS